MTLEQARVELNNAYKAYQEAMERTSRARAERDNCNAEVSRAGTPEATERARLAQQQLNRFETSETEARERWQTAQRNLRELIEHPERARAASPTPTPTPERTESTGRTVGDGSGRVINIQINGKKMCELVKHSKLAVNTKTLLGTAAHGIALYGTLHFAFKVATTALLGIPGLVVAGGVIWSFSKMWKKHKAERKAIDNAREAERRAAAFETAAGHGRSR